VSVLSPGTPISDLSARAFNDRIADPGDFSGGGAVAALTAAAAASTALLVTVLSARRRKDASPSPLTPIARRISELRDRFYAAADDDIRALDQLLVAQRRLKLDPHRDAYVDALRAAAESPISLAEGIVVLLNLIHSQLSDATRFTVSDLGAAASLAGGAAQAALLTARVNVVLLRDEAGAEFGADELAARIEALAAHTDNSSRRIVEATLGRIDRRPIAKQGA